MYKIYLSPSNQIHNVGVNGYNEAYSQHKFAGDIKTQLDLNPVFITKISDIKMDLTTACKDTDNFGAHLKVCLHSDAADSPTAGGTTVFIRESGNQSERFANILYKKISVLSPGNDRGVVVRPGLCELKNAKCPAILAETFFHTNPVELKDFITRYKLYVAAYTMAIYEFFNIPYSFVEQKKIIQDHCNFNNPENVWKLFNSFEYPYALYQKLAAGFSK